MSLPIDVQIGRPPRLEQRLVAAEADGRRVVDQRVEPDVDDAAGIERQRDAPRLPGPADRDVLEPALDQAQDLVAADVRLQELRMRREVLEQRLLILRQPEEVVLLADPLRRRRRVQRAVAVDEVLLLLERLAADAVPALVDAFVDVAGRVDAAGRSRSRPRLCRGSVVRMKSSNETSSCAPGARGTRAPSGRSTRADPAPPRRPLEDVLRVLVVPHQEARLDARTAACSGR